MAKVRRAASKPEEENGCYPCHCLWCNGTGVDPEDPPYGECECNYYRHELNSNCCFIEIAGGLELRPFSEMKTTQMKIAWHTACDNIRRWITWR